MSVIGLTGGIASGKSLVSAILRQLGAKVVDADEVARLVVEPGTAGWEEIRQVFGDKILNPDGTINRKALGTIVFADPGQLKKLNEITHPQVYKYFQNEIDNFRKHRDSPALILDVALLIETGFQRLVEEVWLVVVSKEVQLSRLMERDGISREQALQRIGSQMSVEEKQKYADVIIDNSGSTESTRQKVEELWNQRFRSGVATIDTEPA
jgi:dephospho-CoA kinase